MTATQTAHSGHRDPGAAGADIGRQLVAGVGESPDVVFVLASSLYDPSSLLRAIDATCHPVLMVGASSGGVLTRGHGGEPVVSALAIRSSTMQFAAGVGRGLSRDSAAAARALVASFRGAADHAFPHHAAFIMTEASAMQSDDLVEQLTLVTEGLYQFFGDGAGDDALRGKSHLFLGTEVIIDAVVGLEIRSATPLGVGAAHGWEPASARLRVTEADGVRLIGINGLPALEAFRDHAAATGQPFDPADPVPYFLSNIVGIETVLGHRLRVPLAINDDGSLICAPAVPPNAIIRIMRSSASVTRAGPPVEVAGTVRGPPRGRHAEVPAGLASAEPLHLLAVLAEPAGRAAATLELARRLGADEVVVLIHDPEVECLIPAPGSRATLTGGPGWRELLRAAPPPGIHRTELASSRTGELAPAEIHTFGDTTSFVFVGAGCDREAIAALRPALPMLGAALHAEHQLEICRAQLAIAGDATARAVSLAAALGRARADDRRTDEALRRTQAQLQRHLGQARHVSRAAVTLLASGTVDEMLTMLASEARLLTGVERVEITRTDGAVQIVCPPDGPLTDGDQAALGLLAQLASVAVENRRLFDEVESRGQLTAMAATVGAALTAKAEPSAKLRGCAEAVVAHLGAAIVRIWTYDAAEQVLALEASAGETIRLDGPYARVPLGAYEIGRIAESHRPHLTNAMADDPLVSDREWARRDGMVAFAGYPLLVEDRLIGVLAVFARHPLSDDARFAVGSVAHELALGIDRDRAEAERAERERFKALFIGMLGHDLRNPLAAISTGTEAMLVRARRTAPDTDSERTVKSLERTLRSSQRMARMIDQILEFARLQAGGGIPSDRQPADLVDACRGVIDELELAMPERSIEVSYLGDGRGDWDMDRLSQVFSNVIGNALAYGDPDRPVRVAIDAEGLEVTAMIQNFGVPIPAADLPSLFDAFHRNDHRKIRGTKGLGLGLYITHQIVISHGGQLDVTSTLAEGTAFRIRMPRHAAIAGAGGMPS